ncbi:hypothetical protein FZEAL_4154 [Fusarium zealandicum]|uniref:Uncharacterized protein n=1 Tax=Fusarium zealandicum TaxID=1053134 RepID=A0A8H4UN15_9HYPO|nr:hypothetical protein FZEAL_4154 [Fusarium zealandicum]
MPQSTSDDDADQESKIHNSGFESSPTRTGSWMSPCIVCFGDETGGAISDNSLRKESETSITFAWREAPYHDPWIGFSMGFPHGSSNESASFGTRYELSNSGVAKQEKKHWVVVKFPQGQFMYKASPITSDHALLKDLPKRRLSGKAKEYTLLTISLSRAGSVKVEGYGKPFANPGHFTDAWINKSKPIDGSNTLVDLLEQRKFVFLVPSHHSVLLCEWRWNTATLSTPFSYPYGDQHSWDMERYRKMLPKLQGPRFAPAWSFHDDNSHVAVLTQSQVQGILWFREAAQDILKLRMPAYFIEAETSAENDTYYVVIPLS